MPSHPRSQILCVDDDEDACEMLSVLMKSYGIDATCAQSASEAWALIKAQHFDVYMLDAWLPRLSGFDFCRQIREVDSQTPILFYSGAAYEADRQRGIDAGANAYVTKPDLEGLIETIDRLVATARVDHAVVRQIKDHRPLPGSFPAQLFSVKAAAN